MYEKVAEKGESAEHLIEISACRNAGLFRRFSGRKSDVFHSISLIREGKEIGVKWVAKAGQTYLVSFSSDKVKKLHYERNLLLYLIF